MVESLMLSMSPQNWHLAYLDGGHCVSKQNPVTTWSVAPARNANVGLINVPWGTGERGVMGSSRSDLPWNPEATLCLDPRAFLPLTRYGAREHGSCLYLS